MTHPQPPRPFNSIVWIHHHRVVPVSNRKLRNFQFHCMDSETLKRVIVKTLTIRAFNSIVWIPPKSKGGGAPLTLFSPFNSIVWIPLHLWCLPTTRTALFQFHCMDSRHTNSLHRCDRSSFNSIVWIHST